MSFYWYEGKLPPDFGSTEHMEYFYRQVLPVAPIWHNLRNEAKKTRWWSYQQRSKLVVREMPILLLAPCSICSTKGKLHRLEDLPCFGGQAALVLDEVLDAGASADAGSAYSSCE